MITSYKTGHIAESKAAEYLKSQGYKVLTTNWKTRHCEIDIVAQKDAIIHFVEVKYRVRNNQGSGLEYITRTKLKQMRLAAEMWVKENNWRLDYCLSAIELSGTDFRVTNFLPNCT